MKQTLFTTALFILLALPAMAAVTVTGTVFDATGEPVIGASVLEQGTSNGTVTDFDGKFTLDVSDANAALAVSYVGMKTANVSLAGKSSVRVVLQEDTEVIEEVVVIGYGTQKKRDVTTAISSVDTEDLELALILIVVFLHLGEAFDAPNAPGAPEVEDHILTTQTGETQRFAVEVIEGEVGSSNT